MEYGIAYRILKAIEILHLYNKPCRLTDILRQSKMGFGAYQRVREELIETGLIEKKGNSVYITDKGQDFFSRLKELNEIVKVTK